MFLTKECGKEHFIEFSIGCETGIHLYSDLEIAQQSAVKIQIILTVSM